MITITEYPCHHPEESLQIHCNRWQYWGWSETQQSLRDPRYHLLIANSSEAPTTLWVGSLLYWVGVEHGELLYLFTEPEHRNKGIARALFAFMEAQLQKIPTCKHLYLEVRASNQAAQALYRSLQLQEAQIRKKYYEDGEDALIFTKEIASL